jgi:purine-binding chemotaxis protein CheW
MAQPRPNPALLVRISGALCAFPLAEVIEVMRPLPVEPIANTPDLIQGIAHIRGAAVPVIQLTVLFRADQTIQSTRFVTLRVGQRCIALTVQSVIGVVNLSDFAFDSLPPLLKSARTDFIQTLGTLDAELLVMLDTARLVPDTVWQAITQSRASR